MANEVLKAINDLKNSMNTKFNNLNQKVDSLNTKLDESTQIIRALEHSSEVNKATQDKVNHTLAEIQGDLRHVKKDLLGVEAITAKNWTDIIELKVVK